MSHLTDDDLYRASHTHQLEPRPEVYVHLDARQRGLGGASCGPDTLPTYRIGAGVHRFGYRMRPYLVGEEDPAELARQDLG